jgi:methylated-DNA-protein-cysteine methyltransferase related protein
MRTKIKNENTGNGIYSLVYEVVKKIPKGKVVTYGEIARKIGIKDVRTIGWALHKNPDQANIPCHRVVTKDGKLSDNFAFGGYKAQKKLLENEGVVFVSEKYVKI